MGFFSCRTVESNAGLHGSEGFYQLIYIRRKVQYFVNLNVINNPSNNEGLVCKNWKTHQDHNNEYQVDTS